MVSTPPVHDTSPGAPERLDGTEQPDGADEPDAPPPPSEIGAARRILHTFGFHVAALAAFTVPAVVVWWHVWSGHPASALTCGCGDPAQEVWFMAWPAWAISHLHSVFFSGAVNVPHGANLLSNTSGPLIGVVLAPVTWAFGPVTATNVALTLAPALSAWACFAAVRPLVRWKGGAIPAALVYGYSSAIVTSLAFGHVSVTVLVIPPFLFTTLYEIVIRQEHSVRRDGLLLAALLVAQFFISPEILVMCLLLGVFGLLAVAVVGWRQARARAGHALPALGLAVGVTLVLLAYPTWYGLAGPQAVTGVLFALAPITGVPLSGLLVPGRYGARANGYVRFGGYLGRNGPPPDFVGWGVALAAVGSLVVARRRLLAWLLLLLAAATFWLALGAYLISGPSWLGRPWLPWRALSTLPVLKEILPDQFVPLLTLFLAFLLAVGLDALHDAIGRHDPVGRHAAFTTRNSSALTAVATLAVAAVALVPVFLTFETPLRVVRVHTPPYLRTLAAATGSAGSASVPAGSASVPAGHVVLTVPFAVSGSTEPMLWQAMQGMGFRLAGAALKTPDATGAPVGSGPPGSARRILTDLTISGQALPTGTSAQLATVRSALRAWQVDRVVIAGASRDPVYASGFFTAALGVAPVYEERAWAWTLPTGEPLAQPITGSTLSACRVYAGSPSERHEPLAMSRCVLLATGGA